MATVLITGGTGLIGSALTNALMAKGYEIIILTRKPKGAKDGISYKAWNPDEGTYDETAFAAADYIIQLAGANVAEGRWTMKRKKEIIDSRVKSGELIVKALKQISNNVKAVVSASAIGWYGPDSSIPNPKPFVETDPHNNDFLGVTCKQWESATEPVTASGKRLVILRTGIVLSRKGGAYAEFEKPLKFGVASILGSGKQIVSWIHIDDLVKLYISALEDNKLSGVYNAVAPHPVSNKELIIAMAKARGKFYVPIPVPSFALKLALGEMSVEILKSATVSAKKIESTGFLFKYQTIDDAVVDLIKQDE